MPREYKMLKATGIILASALLASVTLTGCATTDTKAPVRNEAEIDPYGSKKTALSSAEASYKKNPKDAYFAARYAKLLRENGDLTRAQSILSPFANKKSMPTLVYTEDAAQDLEVGKFKEAESASRKAIKADGVNYRAYHLLGIALDAQQHHPEAEIAFRKALELWKGDTIPVMNNLALNLAAQGYTDKALDLLYKAKEQDPGRKEIERNIRIIRTLNEPADAYPGSAKKAPEPETKPANAKKEVKAEAPKKDDKKEPVKKAEKKKAKEDKTKPVN